MTKRRPTYATSKSVQSDERKTIIALTRSLERRRFVARVTDAFVAAHEVLTLTVGTDAAGRRTFVDVCRNIAYID